MTIQINLLQNKKDYVKLENAFRILRVATITFGALIIVALVVLFALQRNVLNALVIAREQNNSLQEQIVNLQDRESRLLFIEKKVSSMQKIINDSPDYAFYMETFLAVVKDDSFVPNGSNLIESINIQDNDISATIRFSSFEEVEKFLKKIETDEFLSVFDEVRTNSLQISDEESTQIINFNAKIKKAQ